MHLEDLWIRFNLRSHWRAILKQLVVYMFPNYEYVLISDFSFPPPKILIFLILYLINDTLEFIWKLFAILKLFSNESF